MREHTARCGRSWAAEAAGTALLIAAILLSAAATRGIPALLYRHVLGRRRTLTAGLMQATSLPFIVAATAIGLELGLIDAAETAALVGAGLLSVLLFPLLGLAFLGGGERTRSDEPERLMAM